MKTDMLRTFATAAVTFAVAAAFVSCQVEELSGPDHDRETLTGAVLTFTDAAQASTKTEWNGYTVFWSAGDVISMTYCQEGEWGSRLYESDPLERTSAFAGFSVPTDLEPGTEGAFAFHAVSPASAISPDFSTAPVATLTVPMNQTPSANSYDRAADLMIGHSEQEYAALPDRSVPMLWDRKVAHAEITVKSLTLADGETLRTVTLTMDEGLAVVGDFLYDFGTSELVATDNVSNSVTLDASSLHVDMLGTLRLWAAFMPCRTSSLTVTLETTAGTYTRNIPGCDLKFLANKRNALEVRMEGIPTYPTVIAHRGCWFKNDVPEHSLEAVRMAKRFGYDAVEIDVRTTSDGVMMVLHDTGLKRTMRNAADYSELTTDIAVADLTYEQVRNDYVMASDNPAYREPMRTLEEILNECKKYGLKAMMHTSTWDAYRMAHKILGDGNWMPFYRTTKPLDFARTLSTTVPVFYSVTDSSVDIAEVKTVLEGIVKPCGISINVPEDFTAEYIKSFTEDGYLVQTSNAYTAPYDHQATHNGVTHHLTDFIVMPDQKMNTVDVARGSDIALSSGQTISRGWAAMEYGAITLRLKFTGSLTVTVNGFSYTMTSDGSQEECVGRRFHAVSPSFSIEASSDTEIEYYEVAIKEPSVLVPGTGDSDGEETGTDAASGNVAPQQPKYYMTASDDLNGKVSDRTAGMKVQLLDSKFYAVNERVLSVSFEADKPLARVVNEDETVSESNVVTMTWESDDAISCPKVGRGANPGEYGILCLPGEYKGTFTVKTSRYTYQFNRNVNLTAGKITSVSLDFAAPLVQPVRKVGIMGDSVSTFEGELCKQEYNSWYPGYDPNVTANPDIAVSSKERTWWWMLVNNHMDSGVLDKNSSFSGSRVVSQNRTSNLTQSSVQCGFVDRAYDFADPDIIIIHGGSNDSANNQDLGDYDWGQAVDTSTKHWKYRNAYIQLIKRLQTRYEGVQIIIIVGEALKEEYAASTIAIAEHFGLPYVSFQGVEVEHCSGAHPTYPAFQMMAQTIYNSCKDYLP